MKSRFTKTPILTSSDIPVKYLKKIDNAAIELSQVINFLLYSRTPYLSDKEADTLQNAADILSGIYEKYAVEGKN